MIRRVVVLGLLCCLGATSRAGELPPTRSGALLRWLRTGAYRQTWTPEPAVRESAIGVHGAHVRTWYSPVLVQDLQGGQTVLRRGAAMVKELYLDGTDDVTGWSVMRKVRRRSRGGRGWFFFETLDGRRALAAGRGVPVCVGCHGAGTDFLLSEFRP